MAWALIHLGLLIDFRSRLPVYIDWAWKWLHGNRADRLILVPGTSDGSHE
jgi:NADH dehydrogenase